jgi:hypothetical protein
MVSRDQDVQLSAHMSDGTRRARATVLAIASPAEDILRNA